MRQAPAHRPVNMTSAASQATFPGRVRGAVCIILAHTGPKGWCAHQDFVQCANEPFAMLKLLCNMRSTCMAVGVSVCVCLLSGNTITNLRA